MFSALMRRFKAPQSDRRFEPRGTRIDGSISLAGCHYPLKDWSRRGFSAVGVGAEHYPGDKIALTVEVDLQLEGEPLIFDCCAVVVWVDRERKELAAVFTDLDLRIQEQIMRVLFTRRAQEQGLASPLRA